MKIACPQDELLARLQIAARGVSQRSTVQILSGVLLRAEAGGPVELAATDMELSVRVPVPAQVLEAGLDRAPGPAAARDRESAAAVGGHDRADAGNGRRAHPVRAERVLAARPGRRGLPPPAGSVRPGLRGRAAVVRGDDQPRRQGGVEGRVAAGADGHPGRVRRRPGDDGRHRQLPPEREGGGGAGGRRRCPGDRAGPSPGRALAGGRRTRCRQHPGRDRREPDPVRHGGRVAVGPPHRRPVPELPPAPARRRSSTRFPPPATSCSTWCGARR